MLKRLRQTVTLALLIALASALSSPAGEIQETPLGPLHDVMLSPTFSADGRHFVYVTPKADGPQVLVRCPDAATTARCAIAGTEVMVSGHRRRTCQGLSGATVAAVIDGREGPAYESIRDFVIAGDRTAYVAAWADGMAMVVDGTEETRFDHVHEPVFSQGGERLAYAARRGLDWFIVVDADEGQAYEGVSAPAFSPDGSRIAHAAVSDGKWFVVIDGKPGPEFKPRRAPSFLRPLAYDPDDIVFSPDGRHIAYSAERDRKKLVVVDGKEWPAERHSGRPVFSPDGSRVAWVSPKPGQDSSEVVVDGQATLYRGLVSQLTFSPDGRRLAYVVTEFQGDGYAARSAVVLDGEQQAWYKPMRAERTELIFSPDSQHLAYIAPEGQVVLDGDEQPLPSDRTSTLLFSPRNQLVYIAKDQGPSVVANGDLGPRYYSIAEGSICFSPDGSRMAYVARRPNSSARVAVVDGEEGPEYHDIPSGRVLFGPDGRHFAYIARTDGGLVAVLDNQEQGTHDDILAESLSLNPAGEHIAYLARDADGWRVIVDDSPGPAYDGVVPGGPRYREDRSLEYLAHRDGVLYRVVQAGGEQQ